MEFVLMVIAAILSGLTAALVVALLSVVTNLRAQVGREHSEVVSMFLEIRQKLKPVCEVTTLEAREFIPAPQEDPKVSAARAMLMIAQAKKTDAETDRIRQDT